MSKLTKIINWLFRIKSKEIIKEDKKPEVIVVNTVKEVEEKYEDLKNG